MSLFHKILVPLDGSRAAEASLEQSSYLATLGLSRFLLGSIAERVLRHANCPVLVVRRNP